MALVRSLLRRRAVPQLARSLASQTETETTQAMTSLLEKEIKCQHVQVVDVSGGCGSMYNVLVVSEAFDGIPLLKQHRMVKEVLSKEIAAAHGIVVKTMTPIAFEQAQERN